MLSNKAIQNITEITDNLGEYLISNRIELTENSFWQKNNLKTKADEYSHNFLYSSLKKVIDIPILSEEGGIFNENKRPDNYWIIDPIDGTRSYFDGFAGWVIQLCLIHNGSKYFSLVHAPMLNETYVAIKDAGAFLNNKRLKKLSNNKLKCSLIDNYPEPRGISKYIFESFRCNNYIEMGSLGLKICKVSAGIANIFVKDVVIRDWDIAPAHLILNEVGGVLTEISGNDYRLSGGIEKNGLIVTDCISNHTKCMSSIHNYKELNCE